MTFDLSAITDSLTDLVKANWANAPLWAELEAGSSGPPTPTFTPNVSGLPPNLLHKEDGPQLSLFLYHAEPNNAVESMFWAPQSLSDAAHPGQPVRFLPLALNLYYLMSAFAGDNYHWEQQAMSVAMRIFHANPIVSRPVSSPLWELSLTMENRPYNEMSELWQATTVPMRLSVVYRAAVVLIDPDTLPAGAPEMLEYNVIVEQGTAVANTVELFGTFRQASYVAPDGPVSFTQSPATVAPGQQVWLMGAKLAGAQIKLLADDGGSTDITGWVVDADSTATRVVLQVPSTSPPTTGRYQVEVAGDRAPLSLAAYVDPTSGPVLPSAASINVTGTGFVAGATDVQVGTFAIPTSQLSVAADGSSLTFPTPLGPSGTVAPLNVQVHGIASDPALWVTL